MLLVTMHWDIGLYSELCSQRKAQVISIRDEIECKGIICKVEDYQNRMCSWSLLNHEKLRERREMEGVS